MTEYEKLYNNFKEEQISREEIFNGRVLHVVNDKVKVPNGNISTREVILHNGAVCVIPITEEGEVIFVRQYRYAFDQVMWEIPAGKLEPGETDRLAAAIRELREETGCTADKITYIGEYYGSPAILHEEISMYLATELSYGEQSPDEDEFLDVIKLPLEKAVEMVLNNEITDGKTQLAILKSRALMERGLLK